MTGKDVADFVLTIAGLLLSWPAVGLIIAVVLRRQLMDLLTTIGPRLTKAKFGSAAIEFAAPKTADTPVGKTNVSAIPTKFDTDSLAFRSRRFGFEISYPAGPNWEVDLAADDNAQTQFLAQQGQIMTLYVRAQADIGGFRPNINVILQPVGDMTITQYMAVTLDSFAKTGIKVLDYHLDPATNGASCSYRTPISAGPLKGRYLQNVARVAIVRGLAFLATSTTLEGTDLPETLRRELVAILNSFQVDQSS